MSSGFMSSIENRWPIVVVGNDSLLINGLVGLLRANGRDAYVRAELTARDQQANRRVNRATFISIVVIGGPEDLNRAIHSLRNQTPILLVSAKPLAPADLATALLSNVVGISDPSDGISGVLSALESIDAGRAAWSIDQLCGAAQQLSESERTTSIVALTEREHEVLRLLYRGESIRSLAAKLNISPKTVESLQRGLYRKLGVRNKIQAIDHGLTRGLLP